MFSLQKKMKLNGFLSSPQGVPPRVFEPTAQGKVITSLELKVEASNFEDYSLNNLIAAGVAITDGKTFETVDLNVHDEVDHNVSEILENENIKNQKMNNDEK